jgi:trans-AT polyketide synthase, acyltransferase and oxidoreductase domains
MTTACLFPGQGSQFVGMGRPLFARFATLAEQASDLLGYSIASLCLEGPAEKLNLTQYTQTAIYVVSTLSYLALREDEDLRPDIVAGHSLGEYGALFAAECFDFETGLMLVRERARLMGLVSGTSMTAITQFAGKQLINLLTQEADFGDIDVANFNTPSQTVVSGDTEQLKRLAVLVEERGGRAFPLKVSAAFHSRYMRPAQHSFADFAAGIVFRPPRIPVIANISAGPYPTDCDAIRDALVGQIVSPVRWLDTVRLLHERGVERFVETEPGTVLSRLNKDILKDAPKRGAASIQTARRPRVGEAAIFLCPGPGGQYLGMGQSLYANNAAFRENFDACDKLACPLINESIAAIVYEPPNAVAEFSRTLHMCLANFALSYGVAAALRANGITPVCYVGWSLGEYVALAASGALPLKAAITLLAQQARYIEERTAPAATLNVLANVNIYYGMSRLFADCTLAGIRAQNAFAVTGSTNAVGSLRARLADKGIAFERLQICHGFHSALIDSIERECKADIVGLERRRPAVPVYSSVRRGVVDAVDDDYLWRIFRSRFNFRTALALAKETYRGASLYDLGPSGVAAQAQIIGGGGGADRHAA